MHLLNFFCISPFVCNVCNVHSHVQTEDVNSNWSLALFIGAVREESNKMHTQHTYILWWCFQFASLVNFTLPISKKNISVIFTLYWINQVIKTIDVFHSCYANCAHSIDSVYQKIFFFFIHSILFYLCTIFNLSIFFSVSKNIKIRRIRIKNNNKIHTKIIFEEIYLENWYYFRCATKM